jgi:hypothetical protein
LRSPRSNRTAVSPSPGSDRVRDLASVKGLEAARYSVEVEVGYLAEAARIADLV